MLFQKHDGGLGAKVADLGTAVQLSAADGVVMDPIGTTGYVGKCLLFQYCFKYSCFT